MRVKSRHELREVELRDVLEFLQVSAYAVYYIAHRSSNSCNRINLCILIRLWLLTLVRRKLRLRYPIALCLVFILLLVVASRSSEEVALGRCLPSLILALTYHDEHLNPALPAGERAAKPVLLENLSNGWFSGNYYAAVIYHPA
jgi:hypothetical protein